MKKITDYDVASGENTVELAERVNEMIGEGWQPHGGIKVHRTYLYGRTDAVCEYLQPMVKYDEKNGKT